MDLGNKEKPIDALPAAPGESKEPKVNYPNFDVRDEVADMLREQFGLGVDSSGSATIKWKVTGDTKDKYSNRLTFEVTSMDGIKSKGAAPGEAPAEGEGEGEGDGDGDEDDEPTAPAGPEDTEADKAEEKILGFKRPKKPKNVELPDTSAKTLLD